MVHAARSTLQPCATRPPSSCASPQLSGAGSFAPGFESSSSFTGVAPSTSLTSEGGERSTTVTAAAGPNGELLNQLVAAGQAYRARAQQMRQAAMAQSQALLANLGSGALLNKLG